jgi:hypothetical protein
VKKPNVFLISSTVHHETTKDTKHTKKYRTINAEPAEHAERSTRRRYAA